MPLSDHPPDHPPDLPADRSPDQSPESSSETVPGTAPWAATDAAPEAAATSGPGSRMRRLILGRPPAPVSPGRRVLLVLAALVFTAAWSFGCNLILDRVQASVDGSRQLDRVFGPGSVVFLISTAVIWVVLIGLVALTGRVLLSCALLLAVTAALSFANYEKLELRREPLYPSDAVFALQPGFLREMVGLRPILELVAGIAVFVLIVLVGSRLLRRVFPPIGRRTEPRLWRAWIVVRVATVAVVATFVVYAVHFNADGNKLREAYLKAGVQWVEWSQRANYLRHGFLAGVLYNTDTPAMKQPEGYSEEAMKQIADRWSKAADAINANRSPDALSDVNVVVILSESFSDPTLLKHVKIDKDPIPYTHHLMEKGPSGEMLSQFIGGGTANIEFETLTGMSLSQFAPQMNTPYQQLVTNYDSWPSAVEYFKDHGHVPLAIHPFRPIMYKRDRVYPVLGFDRFISETGMQEQEHLENNPDAFISDASAFHEVEHQLQEEQQPAFVNLVTMQNHYPQAGKYANPIGVGPSVGVVRPSLSAFVTGENYSDQAMKSFLGDLKDSPEKTAVVFYGDHAPPFWPRAKVFHENEKQLRKTPFFIWTNYKKLPHRDFGLVSPTQFLPLLFNELKAPVTPLYALLDAMRQEVPAMTMDEYHTADGQVYRSVDDLDPQAQALLHDYRMVQYDLSIGKRYSEDTMLDLPSTS